MSQAAHLWTGLVIAVVVVVAACALAFWISKIRNFWLHSLLGFVILIAMLSALFIDWEWANGPNLFGVQPGIVTDTHHEP